MALSLQRSNYLPVLLWLSGEVWGGMALFEILSQRKVNYLILFIFLRLAL